MTEVINLQSRTKMTEQETESLATGEDVLEIVPQVIELLESALKGAREGTVQELVLISGNLKSGFSTSHVGILTNPFIMSSALRKVSSEYEEDFCYTALGGPSSIWDEECDE